MNIFNSSDFLFDKAMFITFIKTFEIQFNPMNFKLNVKLSSPNKKLNFSDNFFFIGSCFAEHISEKFRIHYLNSFLNPNGIVYNPISIAEQLLNGIKLKKYTKEEVFFHDDQWHHFDFHGSFSSNHKDSFLDIINQRVYSCSENIKQADVLFITFGSAFVYKHEDKIVSNCHKLPGYLFKKELLNKDEIVTSYLSLIHELNQINPNLQVVFSISPVRYIRDGIIENNLSKSILIQSVHEIISRCLNCQYFPAYEIITDELRDYRFFKEDLIHPNEIAINYVWEKLHQWMDEETQDFLNDVFKYNQFKNHRLINTAKINQHHHEAELKKKILEQKYPAIKLK